MQICVAELFSLPNPINLSSDVSLARSDNTLNPGFSLHFTFTRICTFTSSETCEYFSHSCY